MEDNVENAVEDAVEDVGTQLRNQREMLGYSLQQAAQHTCIRKTYLESLENNQFSDLPGQAYATGFVKSYALYLGLDNRPLLAELEKNRLTDVTPALKPISVVKHQSKRFSKSSSGTGWGSFTFGLIAVLLLAGVAYFLAPMFQSKAPSEAASEIVLPEKEPAQEVMQKQTEGISVPAPAIGEAEQGVVAPLQEAELAPVSAELKPLPFVSSGGSTLRMLALSKGSLIIYLDNRKPHTYKLHAGLDLSWSIKDSAKVELAGPGMARFWLGGQELGLGEMESFQLQTENGN